MIWLTGITCLAVGLAAGLLLARIIKGDNPARVNELENRLQDLQRDQAEYRDQVSEHFNTTAELVHHMTESYRDVYQHLASGAQNLCTEDVASKLLPAGEQKMFASDEESSNDDDMTNSEAKGNDSIEQPKDYAPKTSPGPGALSEEFGLEKEKQEDQSTESNAKNPGSNESESDDNSDADKEKESESDTATVSDTDKKQ